MNFTRVGIAAGAGAAAMLAVTAATTIADPDNSVLERLTGATVGVGMAAVSYSLSRSAQSAGAGVVLLTSAAFAGVAAGGLLGAAMLRD